MLWHGSNPTFHRYEEYALVLSDKALYWFRPSWVLGWWKQFPLENIVGASFEDSRRRPTLWIELRASKVRCRTPFDSYGDDMDFDRKVLGQAVQMIAAQLLARSGRAESVA